MAQQTGNAPDPLAQLGVPATPSTPAAPADPLAAIGTPATPPPAAPPQGGPASQALEGAKQVAAPIWGAVKPAETPTEAAIHNVGGPGALMAYRTAKGIVDSVDGVIKSAPETFSAAVQKMNQAVDEFHQGRYGAAAGDFAGALTTNRTLNPGPVNDVKDLVEGAQNGNVVTPLVRQGLTGALGAIGGEETGAAGAAEETPGIFKRMIVNPFRKLTATPAEAGAAAETEAATAGTKAVLGNAGTKTMALGIDPAPADAAASSLYQKVDQAAGTDLKVQYQKLANAQDRVMQTVDGSAEESKALADVKAQEDVIAQIKQRAKEANPNLDIDATLAQADKKFTEARANAEFNFKFQSALNGDVRPGAEPTVDVDKAIAVTKKMTQPTVRYPTPRLYQTTIGKTGANEFLDNLYAAKKAGEKAVSAQQTRQWWLNAAKNTGKYVLLPAGGAALGVEALKH